MPPHRQAGFRTRCFSPPAIRCQRWRRETEGGDAQREERLRGGEDLWNLESPVREELRVSEESWYVVIYAAVRVNARGCAGWGGAVATLRWIRSICMFPQSSTQQCLRVWPLRAPSLSQTRVGDAYPGAHTVPSAHTRSRGTGGAVWSSLHLWGWLHSRSSQEASRRKDRTHLRSQHKGELAFHWQDTFSGGKTKEKPKPPRSPCTITGRLLSANTAETSLNI